MIEKMRNVYNWLEDDVSKDIYLNRLNYLVTENDKYIIDVAKKYCSDIMMDFKDLTLLKDIEERGLSKDIIVYGAGRTGIRFVWDYMQWKGCRIKYICDADKRKRRSDILEYRFISPEEMVKNYSGETVILQEPLYREKRNILNYFVQGGVPEERIIDGTQYGPKGSERQYFYEDFLNYDENEIFADIGAYDLSTTTELKKIHPKLKKSYAFEADLKNIIFCKERIEKELLSYIELIPYGTWSSRKMLSFDSQGNMKSCLSDEGLHKIQVVPIDEVISDFVTFIKMDIEGAEMESLKGAKRVIKQNKPKLAICIYHKYEDMWEIPMYIKSLVPEYKLYVRHYSNRRQETVLYAI